MLTHEEHEAMIMFDRLLMSARENETVADLLDQTLNVARMIDPRPEEKITYGPLQRMHFEWQQMRQQMQALEKKMDTYINSLNRYSTNPWPSNPGLGYPPGTTTIGYPLGINTLGTTTGGYQDGYGPTPPDVTWSTGSSSDLDNGYTAVQLSEIMKKIKDINEPPPEAK